MNHTSPSVFAWPRRWLACRRWKRGGSIWLLLGLAVWCSSNACANMAGGGNGQGPDVTVKVDGTMVATNFLAKFLQPLDRN
jgi:hypothetical protein